MSLTPLTSKYDAATGTRVTTPGETTAIGRVLAITSRCVRIMSDVWADQATAHILNEQGGVVEVVLGNNEFGWNYDCRVDAPPEVIAAWEAAKEAALKRAEAARQEMAAITRQKEAEASAKQRALAPRRGALVRVVAGRKVPKGTEGVVFWMGEGSYGERVGITVEGKAVYTASSNVQRIVNRHEGETWVEFLNRTTVALPRKGEGVRILATGVEGNVFYQNMERIGIATTTRMEQGRNRDVIWCSASDVERLPAPVTLPAGTPTIKSEPAPPSFEIDVEIPF